MIQAKRYIKVDIKDKAKLTETNEEPTNGPGESRKERRFQTNNLNM